MTGRVRLRHAGSGTRALVAAAIAVVVASSAALAGTPAIFAFFSSPPSPVGAGARATGVGSAFIAVADDATAASWNPAGLVQLERPEVSAVARYVRQTDRFGSGSETLVVNDIEQTLSIDGREDSFGGASLDFASVAIPFTVAGRNVVAALNYQQVFSFDRDLHYVSTATTAVSQAIQRAHYEQHGGIDAVTAAVAVEIVPGLSAGGALNYWMDGLTHPYAWRSIHTTDDELTITGGPTISGSASVQTTAKNYGAFTGALGALWKPSTSLALAAVAKLQATDSLARSFRDLLDPSQGIQGVDDHFRLSLPPSYGFGVAWRPEDKLTLSADLVYVDWDRFRLTDSEDQQFLVSGDPAVDSSVDGVFTARMGVEYVLALTHCDVAGRMGVFYDPEPARGSPRPFYGTSVGVGLAFPSMSVDVAYQARFAVNAAGTFTATQVFAVSDVELTDLQSQLYVSLVKYF